jgi:alpha-glucosidase (family GH31 glycosyl hydrolase)
MDHYYRDEYAYGRSRNPKFITLSRSIDRPFTHPEGFAPLDAAPVTWVGDQDHAWKSGGEQPRDKTHDNDLAHGGEEGIEEALRDILHAARLGYCVVGSDIGGYGGAIIPPRLYIRWTQFSTFCGLFLNGGHGERRLWQRTMQELEIIRTFSWLHTELVPYMYSHVVRCAKGGKPLQQPVEGKYHYLFGDDLLIAPIYQDSLQCEVHLPSGRWRYWFQDDWVVEGPVVLTRDFPLDEYPVFVREGAIIPMHVSRAYTGIGEADWDAYLTLNVYPSGAEKFLLHHTDQSGTMQISVTETSEHITVQLGGTVKPHILRIYLEKQPLRILRDGAELEPSGDWQYLVEASRLLVRSDGAESVQYQIDLER